ncbi:fasciclin domain-containing protein [Ferruginibacter paludis]|uniref:fasciclin domain-containing protein n=1 Tax=Ferruginibacter paludis TaxID=1310417 RepID=UPI0025B2B922|nr:fasciclin domain-containing protein [Ferruginibacter paludis]MDN3654878.1 fasciclin domain-containing protein [Ferruginibacter paludis]
MKYITQILKNNLLHLVAVMLILASCNKDVEQFTETPVTPPGGKTLGETIAATPTDSLYYRLIIKSGLLSTINNKAANYTMLVPDNNGMKAFINFISKGQVPIQAPDAVFSGFIAANIPVASAAGIVSYNIIGQTILSAKVPATFPNFQLPTQIILPQAPPVNSLIRATTFFAPKLAYVNNIPVTAVDAVASNGIIHHVATVVAPPTTVLAGLIYTDPDLSYFTAAIARGDSGQVGLNKFDSLLKYGVTNMTVLAPNNAAFQNLIYGSVYGNALAHGAPPQKADSLAKAALAAGPAIFMDTTFGAVLPASSVRGILAYHLLASNSTGSYKPDIRAFSTDFSATPTLVKTLVNSSFGVHPGVLAQATYTGPFVTKLTFTGLGTFPPGGTPFSGGAANVVGMDKHAVNGVLHVIDKVLLPQ